MPSTEKHGGELQLILASIEFVRALDERLGKDTPEACERIERAWRTLSQIYRVAPQVSPDRRMGH